MDLSMGTSLATTHNTHTRAHKQPPPTHLPKKNWLLTIFTHHAHHFLDAVHSSLHQGGQQLVANQGQVIQAHVAGGARTIVRHHGANFTDQPLVLVGGRVFAEPCGETHHTACGVRLVVNERERERERERDLYIFI